MARVLISTSPSDKEFTDIVLEIALRGGKMSYTMSAIIRRRLTQESNPENRETLLNLLALVEPSPEPSLKAKEVRKVA